MSSAETFPGWAKALGLTVASIALIPLALIARARTVTTTEPRIHIIRDMDNQPRFKAQQRNDLFADHRAMRPPVPGTVARGELMEDDHLHRGMDQDGKFLDSFPAQVQVDKALLERGRERYGIFCAPCHGYAGHGDGPIHQRVGVLQAQGREGIEWAPPTSYHSDTIRQKPVGYLFHVMTHGVRNMAPYAAQLSEHDRWAVAAWIKALQKNQSPEN
jgi:mono/diheme cytochrome c family protein